MKDNREKHYNTLRKRPTRTARVNSSLILPNQSQRSSFAVIGYDEAGRGRKSPMTSLTYRDCRLL